MIRRDDKGQRETQFFVDVDLAGADPFGLSVGRFYDRHPGGAFVAGKTIPPGGGRQLSRYDMAHTVARWTHGAHIVGAVPSFDTEVLAKVIRSEKLIPAWHYHLTDVENLAVGFLAGRGRVVHPPWSSDELTELLGVAPATEAERHTALGDARWAARIYDHVMGGPS